MQTIHLDKPGGNKHHSEMHEQSGIVHISWERQGYSGMGVYTPACVRRKVNLAVMSSLFL